MADTKTVKKEDGTPLTAGDVPAGATVTIASEDRGRTWIVEGQDQDGHEKVEVLHG